MANFDASAFEAVVDVACAGWFALYIEEDPDEGGLRFHQWPLSSVYVTTTGPVRWCRYDLSMLQL